MLPGRPCDYSRLSYDRLDQAAGIQWPCTDEAAGGTERLYTDGNTAADYCELDGHDLVTGAEISPAQYRADDPKGRGVIKPADYMPPVEEPDAQYPFWLTTGRLVYHWHSRSKTGRVPALREAAPAPFVEISHEDAERLGIRPGDRVRMGSRRGFVEIEAKVADIVPGHLFMPFHYGEGAAPGGPRAANELTVTD